MSIFRSDRSFRRFGRTFCTLLQRQNGVKVVSEGLYKNVTHSYNLWLAREKFTNCDWSKRCTHNSGAWHGMLTDLSQTSSNVAAIVTWYCQAVTHPVIIATNAVGTVWISDHASKLSEGARMGDRVSKNSGQCIVGWQCEWMCGQWLGGWPCERKLLVFEWVTT